MNNILKVTDSALNRLKVLRAESNIDDSHFIRVSVKGGGCSGLKYDLSFDDQINEDDSISEHEINVVCDKRSVLYLMNTTLDYSGGLNGKGFVFNNPNASRTCGCGESFSL